MLAHSKNNVLMLTSTLPRWKGDSTPRFVLDLAATLAEFGWRIDLLAPGYKGAAGVEAMEGTTVHRFPYVIPSSMQTLCYSGGIMPNVRSNPAKSVLVPPFLASAFIATRRLISRLKPVLIHAHWTVPMGLVAALVAPRATPVAVTVHGSDVLDLGGSILNRLKSRVLARADIITCNGSITEAAVVKLLPPGKRIMRIPMGARIAQPGTAHGVSMPAGRFIILFAGRLFRGKGLDDLLDAIADFGSGTRPFLLVAGTGPEETRFKRRAESLELASDIAFLGGLDHSRLLALMQDVNAVVVPTRNTEWIEAQGLVIAESMLAGVPTIATLSGGAEDHVQDGKTGLLVPPRDPVAIRSALTSFIEDPSAARAIGDAGRHYALGNLTWKASARAFDTLYYQAGETAARK